MNYSDLNDFEINKLVAESRGMVVDGGYLSISAASAGFTGNGDLRPFDPCNNPSDAWPIIVENRISVLPWYKPLWHSYSPDTKIRHPDKNPLRAAMIVYLMMKDAENEV